MELAAVKSLKETRRRFVDGTAYCREFLWRRRANWLPIFFLYAAFYFCRYNINVAKMFVGYEHGWTKAMIGDMVGSWAIAYAAGQFINGQIADAIGGRYMMSLGALLTGGLNILFGLVAPTGSLTVCTLIWACSGYTQAMAAPSFVKIHTSWFGLPERGIFTGLFAMCTQIGSLLANVVTGFIVASMHWQWAFFWPAICCLAFGVVFFLFVRDRPEREGFGSVDTGEDDDPNEKPPGIAFTLKKVFTSGPILLVAVGYFCVGIVRYGLFTWYPDYLHEVHRIATDSTTFQVVSWLIPLAGIAGGLLTGWISDSWFQSRRAPIVALMFLGQAVMMIIFYYVAGPVISGVLFVFLAFFINGPHSLLGSAASMDFGGRKAAASAAGVIDAFQYLGMFAITSFGGRIIQAWGWNGWILILIAAALTGMLLLSTIWNVRPGRIGPRTPSAAKSAASQGATP